MHCCPRQHGEHAAYACGHAHKTTLPCARRAAKPTNAVLAELLAAARTQAGKARGSSSNLAGAVSGGGGDGGGGSEEGELMDADADLAPGAKRRASPVQVRRAR